MTSKDKYVLVDICGTLFHSNTTYDFIDFSIKCWHYRFFRSISKSLLWRLINKLVIQLFKVDLTRLVMLRYLKGKSINELDLLMDSFYNNKLNLLKQKIVWDKIDAYSLEGCKIILVSATFDFIAKKIASECNLLYYSSTLSYQSNHFSGQIEKDIIGTKLLYLKSCNINPTYFRVITNDFSDIDIIKNAEKSIIISPVSLTKKWINFLNKEQIESYEIICPQ